MAPFPMPLEELEELEERAEVAEVDESGFPNDEPTEPADPDALTSPFDGAVRASRDFSAAACAALLARLALSADGATGDLVTAGAAAGAGEAGGAVAGLVEPKEPNDVTLLGLLELAELVAMAELGAVPNLLGAGLDVELVVELVAELDDLEGDEKLPKEERLEEPDDLEVLEVLEERDGLEKLEREELLELLEIEELLAAASTAALMATAQDSVRRQRDRRVFNFSPSMAGIMNYSDFNRQGNCSGAITTSHAMCGVEETLLRLTAPERQKQSGKPPRAIKDPNRTGGFPGAVNFCLEVCFDGVQALPKLSGFVPLVRERGPNQACT